MESEMEAEGWPALRLERFEGEPPVAYRSRSAEILEIVEGFRMGRYRGDIAERMERRLIRLQEQSLELLSA
jgi:hypothetical protein